MRHIARVLHRGELGWGPRTRRLSGHKSYLKPPLLAAEAKAQVEVDFDVNNSDMAAPILVLDNGAYTIKAGVVGQDGDPR